MYCFGVDLGGTTVKMGLFQDDGCLLDKWEIKTRVENEGEAILPDIAASIKEKMEQMHIEKEHVIGIGLGVPAAVVNGAEVMETTNLGWGYKAVKRELEELIGISVRVENDANVAALGEMWQGGGKGYNSLVMVTLGTGVGGGIIVNGRILSGKNGGGGEIGHLVVQPDETDKCGCGKTGCLEQYASATGIARLARRKLAGNQTETVLRAEGVTAKDVFDAVKAGDAVAKEIAEEFGAYLGYALSNVGAVLDPEVFVIGGGVSKAGEILLDYIKKYYVEKAYNTCENAEFVLAQLQNDAGIYGAAKLVLAPDKE